ncbi:hypothetical protein CV014_06115 [Nostoc sp. CMAA1605]|nr:hypothetical protein [Nostoc sp. CMAA1605]
MESTPAINPPLLAGGEFSVVGLLVVSGLEDELFSLELLAVSPLGVGGVSTLLESLVDSPLAGKFCSPTLPFVASLGEDGDS